MELVGILTQEKNSAFFLRLPKDVMQKARIDKGDTVMAEYNGDQGTILVSPPRCGKRKTWVLGKRLGIKEIEAGIERGQSEK